MFENLASTAPEGDAAGLEQLIETVRELDGSGAAAATLIDQIASLERLEASCAATQARLTQAFATTQSAAGNAKKVPADRVRLSVARQVALARSESPFRGGRLLGVANALTSDMPETLAALAAGRTSERRVVSVITQFACLTPTDRRKADALIGPNPARLGDRASESAAAGIAARLDPEAVLAKIRGAVKDRHVSVRPAPDTMARFSALLSVAQGVGVYAALRKAAGRQISAGDVRQQRQIMADELFSRVTGRQITGCDPYGVPQYASTNDGNHAAESSVTDPPDSETVYDAGDDHADIQDAVRPGFDADETPVRDCEHEKVEIDSAIADVAPQADNTIQLRIIMTDRGLFGDDDEPAHLIGFGPIPGPLGRALLAGADEQTKIWVKRLYTDPVGTQLLATDSRARLFPSGAKDFLISRDQICRTPWCDAPIRHLDHVIPYPNGGGTRLANGQGLCAACNLSKEGVGWTSTSAPEGTVFVTTPTGHVYSSSPPRPPHSEPWPPEYVSVVDLVDAGFVRAA